jgi:amino-acid N-acetyltransferase
MYDQINYRYAEIKDFEAIVKLLTENNLPVVDIDLLRIKFIVAESKDKLVGCISLEPYGSEGLLRSLAVDINFRKLGTGNCLLQYLISYSRQIGIENLHLLTSTAESYFLSKNFVKADRQEAPESIKHTYEFSTLCPSSASYMVFSDIGQNGQKFSNNLYVKKLDIETHTKLGS